MRVFVTGATGFVGSAIVEELMGRGHEVVGLARSDAAAHTLEQRGVAVHRGDMTDHECVISGITQVDAVIHTAFNHDFAGYVQHCQADARLLEVMAHALHGTHTPLVAASATSVTMAEGVVTEQEPAHPHIPRSASERFLKHARHGVLTNVVRLPPTVHGQGDSAFIPMLISLARARGESAYIGDGENRWPAVHRDDAARLFCDVVEQPREGARYHAVHEPGIPFRTIATAIGEGLGLPTRSIDADKAEAHFDWMSMFAALDHTVSSDWTRRTTGWTPRAESLLEDLNSAGYFEPTIP